MSRFQQILNRYVTLENICYYFVIVFCTRYILIDTRAGVSLFKVAVSTLTPFIFILCKPAISKCNILATVYFIYIFITAYFHPTNFRLSTLLYLLSFLMSYCTFYHLVYVNRALCINHFINFVKYAIIVSTIILLLQQIFIIVGIKQVPILNLTQILDRGIGANSLYGEPSVFARVMGVLYYAYLKCNEHLSGNKQTIATIISSEHRWVTITFLWSMLTMGSGTAFICLAVLSLYFMKGFQFIYAIPIFVSVFFILDFFEIRQFERARTTIQATMTGDSREVREADGSAAVRIKPFLNTLQIDLTKSDTWFGKGCDSGIIDGLYGDERYIGEISDYGLIAYILGLLLVFSCAIKPFSLPALMYFAGIGGGTGNIAYVWGILLLFTCTRYFSEIARKDCVCMESDIKLKDNS